MVEGRTLANLLGGWQLGGTPIMTADWTEKDNNRYSIPLGIAGFKTILFGKVPVKLGIEARTFLRSPDDFGPKWEIEFSIIPITGNFFNKLFNPGA